MGLKLTSQICIGVGVKSFTYYYWSQNPMYLTPEFGYLLQLTIKPIGMPQTLHVSSFNSTLQHHEATIIFAITK